MKHQYTHSLIKHRYILIPTTFFLVLSTILVSYKADAATGVQDFYIIDSSENSETIVVTANDRLVISTQEAIDYIDIISISDLSEPNAGSIQIDPDDSFSINVFPTPGYSGIATFTYRVRDIRGISDSTSVTLNIVSSTSVLEAVDDQYISSRSTINIFPPENDIQPGFGFHVEILSQPDIGSLSEAGILGLYRYTPPADINDRTTVNFDYRLVSDDGSFSSDPATITIEVDPTLEPIANAGADEAQSSLANTLQLACDINSAGIINAINESFADSCAALLTLSGAELDNALEDILLRQVGAQANSMKGLAANQVKNIGARLQELRRGVTGVSLAGLQANIDDQNLSLERLLTRVDNKNHTGGGAGDPSHPGRLGGFVTGTINIGEGESRKRENSFDIDNQELLAGLDYRFNNELVMGAALGYSMSETEENNGDTGLDVDGWNLSLYGNYYAAKNWYIDWLLGYGESSIDSSRSIEFASISTKAKGSTDADIFSALVGAGYTQSYQSWNFDTYTNLEYRTSTVDAYRESNDAGLDLNIYKTTTDVFSGRLGLRASKAISLNFGVVTPQFELELVKDFKNEAPDIEAEFALTPEAGTFTLTNEDPDDSYVNAGLSVAGVFKNGVTGFFRYNTMLAKDDVRINSWQLGARKEFGGPAEDIHLFQSRDTQLIGAGAFMGTTGYGLALSVPVRYEDLNFRAVMATLPYDSDRELDDIDYEIDFDVFSFGTLLDWYPLDNEFRISGGLFLLQADISATSTPNRNVEIGNTTFTPGQVGTLTAEVDYSRNLATYIGIGWGNAVKSNSKFTFSMDIGLLFTDNPTASLEADSPLAETNPVLKAQLESELAVEENRVNDDLDDFKLWPVINFGVAYHFQ